MKKIPHSHRGTRPFVLVKAFTLSSFIVMLTATVVIAALNAHWVRAILLEKSKEYNILLTENLNHQIFLRFVAPVAFQKGEIKLREKNQHQLLDRVIKSTLHSFHVEMVTIYGTDNIIGYSFDSKRIGEINAGGVNYEKAMNQEATTKLIQKGSFIELFLGFPKETKIITFAPLMQEMSFAPSRPKDVIGVIEIIRDISDDYQQVFKLQGLVVISCSVVMGILFLTLRYVVKHGEQLLQARAEERLKLEEKLRQAEHLSAIGEMTAGVSHEIRNPLGIIKSSAQLMKKKMEKMEIDSHIPNIIVEESQRLDHIIKDFLDFARPRKANLHTCSIKDIIDKNIAFISPQLEEQNIDIDLSLPPDLPPIMADPAMLYQAFLNILLNAVQANDEQGTISIVVQKRTQYIHILFKDSGDGIDETLLKKIWSPFFTTKDYGTGLGLGIVKNIINAHMGEIHIRNSELSGAIVEILLPVKES